MQANSRDYPGVGEPRAWLLSPATISFTCCACGFASLVFFCLGHNEPNLGMLVARGLGALVAIAFWALAFILAGIGTIMGIRRKSRWGVPLLALVLSVVTPAVSWYTIVGRPTQTDFVAAVERGDEAAVRRALRFGLPLDQYETHVGFSIIHGHTPLTAATASGRLDLARLLLDHGATVSAPNGSGVAPLSMAAMSGQAAIVDLLLVRGANPNARNKDGSTALYYAAVYGEVNVTRRLLAGGADPDLRAGPGNPTPIEVALGQLIPRGDPDGVIRELAAHGADMHIKDWRGRTPAEVLAARGNAALTAPLTPTVQANSSPRDRFFAALANNNEAQALAMLDQDPHLAGKYADRNIFAAAVRARMPELIKAFLDRGSLGAAVLNEAADTGDEKILELVAAGDAKNWARVLHHAASWGRLDVVKIAVAHGVDVNSMVLSGQVTQTPLHAAAGAGHVAVLTYLLDHGSDVNARAPAGTPVDEAVLHNEAGTLRLLARRSGKGTRVPVNREVLKAAGIATDADYLRVFADAK